MWIHKIRRFLRMHTMIVIRSAIIIAVFLAVCFGIIPATRHVLTLWNETNTLSTEIATIQKKVALLDSYDNTMLENAYANVEAALPEEKSIDTLLATVETTAGKHGLTLGAFSLEKIGSIATSSASGKSSTAKGTPVVSAAISVAGDLIGIRNFLADIVKVRRLVRVRDIRLSFLKTKQTMSADVALEVFYQPLPTKIGKVSESIDGLNQKQTTILETISAYPVAYNTNTTTVTTPVNEPMKPAMINPFNPNPE